MGVLNFKQSSSIMDKAWRIFALILLVEVHLVYPAESPTYQWDTTTRYPTDRTTGYPWISTTRYPTDRTTGYPGISTTRYPMDRPTHYPTDRTTRYPTGRTTTPVRQSTTERPYVTTERPYSTTERLDSTTSAESCPDDWIDGGYIGCYKFLDDLSVNWIDAEGACEREGGYLAEPKTTSQMEFLASMSEYIGQLSGINKWHIGLMDLEREGTWMWLHSVELAAVQGWWGAHSPNNDPANSDDCGKLVVDKSWFYLEDINCAHFLAAPLCQRNKFIRA